MENFDQLLEKYAEVIVKVGLNLQPGQRLTISAEMETLCDEFIRRQYREEVAK